MKAPNKCDVKYLALVTAANLNSPSNLPFMALSVMKGYRNE